MSCRYGTGKSTTALAQPWDLLPALAMVPLRTCQTTPFTSRSRVIRRLTASTVPDVPPTSMTSPTPYWSSSSMKIPARKSCTRFCAPNPMATPRTPALASTGARFSPMSPRIMTAAMPKMVSDAALLRIAPSAVARCCRRSRNSSACVRSLPSGSSLAAREVILAMARCAARRSSSAIRITKPIRTAVWAGPAK